MVAYTTLAALTARYGEDLLIRATDRGMVPTDQIDVSVVAKACDDASALIDGYLMGRYALPMAEVPPLIAALAEDVAIYRLHPNEPDPKIKADYEAAIRSLEAIGKGAIRLPIAGVEAPASSEDSVRFTEQERPFTTASMKGFI